MGENDDKVLQEMADSVDVIRKSIEDLKSRVGELQTELDAIEANTSKAAS